MSTTWESVFLSYRPSTTIASRMVSMAPPYLRWGRAGRRGGQLQQQAGEQLLPSCPVDFMARSTSPQRTTARRHQGRVNRRAAPISFSAG